MEVAVKGSETVNGTERSQPPLADPPSEDMPSASTDSGAAAGSATTTDAVDAQPNQGLLQQYAEQLAELTAKVASLELQVRKHQAEAASPGTPDVASLAAFADASARSQNGHAAAFGPPCGRGVVSASRSSSLGETTGGSTPQQPGRTDSVGASQDGGQQPAQAPPQEVPMAATRVVMHEIVLPYNGDLMGICFGGQVLSWIDICAGLAAKTVARGPCVTASLDSVHFLRPIRVGSVAIIAGMVNRTFQSSMEVGVRVEEEDMRTGARHHCCSAYLTFVSIQARAGGPVLARVVGGSAYERGTHEAAQARRQERLAARAAVRHDPRLAAAEAEAMLQPITHRQGSRTLAPALQSGVGGGGAKRRVSPGATVAHMTQLIMPQHANSLGITFGGQVMRWMEQCAYIAGSRVGRGVHLLTASMDSIAFKQPTRVGNIMYITSQVTGIFGSSMEVLISVHGEDPAAGQLFHCGNAYATIVSVAPSGQPVPVPFELAPEQPVEFKRCQGAEARRRHRLAMRRGLQEQVARRPSLDGTRLYGFPSEDQLFSMFENGDRPPGSLAPPP